MTTPNRHMRRAMKAAKPGKALTAAASLCSVPECPDLGVVAVVRGGEMRGVFCAAHEREYDAAFAAREAARREAELAALPFFRRVLARLFIAWSAWRIRRAAKRIQDRPAVGAGEKAASTSSAANPRPSLSPAAKGNP